VFKVSPHIFLIFDIFTQNGLKYEEDMGAGTRERGLKLLLKKNKI
jgi:hypothetical protein